MIAGHDLGEEQERFFLETAQRFLLCADSVQIRLAPAKFAAICRKYKDIHVRLGSPRKAVSPLQSACLRLQPAPDVLTPVHADLLQVCLLSKFYGVALPLVDQGHLGIVDPKKTGLNVKDFLLYSYYGGMVLVGEKKFSRALEFFLNALTVPASALSAIMIASYKKYILVCLLLHGDVPPIPEYTSPVVRRTVGNHCSEYLDLLKAFANLDMKKLKELLQAHQSVFEKDHNWGLAKQCIRCLQKRVVQRLTQTYLTLSLQDLAEAAQIEDPKVAEKCVLGMIEEGEIFATINQKDKMVSFYEDPEEYNSTDMLYSMQDKIDGAIQVADRVRAVDDILSGNRDYLMNTAMAEKTYL